MVVEINTRDHSTNCRKAAAYSKNLFNKKYIAEAIHAIEFGGAFISAGEPLFAEEAVAKF